MDIKQDPTYQYLKAELEKYRAYRKSKSIDISTDITKEETNPVASFCEYILEADQLANNLEFGLVQFIKKVEQQDPKELKEEPSIILSSDDTKYLDTIDSPDALHRVIRRIELFRKGLIPMLDIPNPLWAEKISCTYNGKIYKGFDVYTMNVSDDFTLKEFDITLYSRYRDSRYKKEELKVLSPRIKQSYAQVSTLQNIRDKLVKKYPNIYIYIASGYRSDNYGKLNGIYYHGLNGYIGGATNSDHTKGWADDIDVKGLDKYLKVSDYKIAEGVINLLRDEGVKSIELTYGIDNNVHFSKSTTRTWYSKQQISNGKFYYTDVNPDLWTYRIPV